jgi:hypothetical protein
VAHSQPIALVATTEQGDAAFTVDSLEQARLWPALDGSREPVIVHVPPTADVVLVRTRDGLLGAVLDSVGGLELIRFDAAGAVTGRSRLAPDPGFAEIDALGDRVLARRRDQMLVMLDAHGKERAALAANAGEHIQTVSTRGGRAIVGITKESAPTAEPAMDRVRIVDTRAGLAWGSLHALPAPLTGTLALSPSGMRIAGLLAADGQLVIATPGADAPTPIAARPDRFPAGTFLGFLDDETLLAASGTLVHWRLAEPISRDPWATLNLDVQGNDSTLAIANGLVVGARGLGLQLVEPTRSRHLGYRQLANGSAQVFGRVGAVASAQRVTWLDRDLREVTARVFPSLSSRRDHYVIDGNHVVQVDRMQAPRSDGSVYLYGSPAQPPILLGTWSEIGTPTFHPGTGVLAIPTVKGQDARRHASIERFELDLAAHTTRRLTPLVSDVLLSRVEVLDPAEAHGLVAAGSVWWSTSLVLVRFVESNAPTIHGQRVDIEGSDIELGIDRSGTAYFLRHLAKEIVRVPASGTSSTQHVSLSDELGRVTGKVSPDGTLIVLVGAGMVIAIDREGTERWRIVTADAPTASFRDDGTLVFSSGNGIITVDPTTGKRLARGCAYAFELSAHAPSIESFQGENACTVEE